MADFTPFNWQHPEGYLAFVHNLAMGPQPDGYYVGGSVRFVGGGGTDSVVESLGVNIPAAAERIRIWIWCEQDDDWQQEPLLTQMIYVTTGNGHRVRWVPTTGPEGAVDARFEIGGVHTGSIETTAPPPPGTRIIEVDYDPVQGVCVISGSRDSLHDPRLARFDRIGDPITGLTTGTIDSSSDAWWGANAAGNTPFNGTIWRGLVEVDGVIVEDMDPWLARTNPWVDSRGQSHELSGDSATQEFAVTDIVHRLPYHSAHTMMSWLPRMFQEDPYLRSLLQGHGLEVDVMRAVFDDVVGGQYVQSASEWALRKWEQLTGLPVAPDNVAEADRRAAILGQIQDRPRTVADFEAIIQRVFPGVDFTIIENFATYTMDFNVYDSKTPEEQAAFEAVIRAVLPAHLDATFAYGGFIAGVSKAGDSL